MSVWLCTRNDCIANIAVTLAGTGVRLSGTPWPDIAVAAIIAYLGLSSTLRVIRQPAASCSGNGCSPVFQRSKFGAKFLFATTGLPGIKKKKILSLNS
jgi:hypothetical protein